MNDDNEQPEPFDPQHASGATPLANAGRTSRRRLMLGVGAAAAIPSVSTLAGGSHTANLSVSACWSKDQEQWHSTPERVTSQPDGWLRKQVYEGKRQGDRAYCLMWDQANGIQSGEPGKAKAGTAWLVNDTRVLAGKPDAITGVSHHPRAFALVYVSETGDHATLDPEMGQNVQPVRETCFTSMLGSKGSNLG